MATESDPSDSAKVQRVIDAALAAAGGDPSQAFAALVSALITFCGDRVGADKLLGIALEMLERARVQVQTGIPMFRSCPGAPS